MGSNGSSMYTYRVRRQMTSDDFDDTLVLVIWRLMSIMEFQAIHVFTLANVL